VKQSTQNKNREGSPAIQNHFRRIASCPICWPLVFSGQIGLQQMSIAGKLNCSQEDGVSTAVHRMLRSSDGTGEFRKAPDAMVDRLCHGRKFTGWLESLATDGFDHADDRKRDAIA
jgi:hypothetical protein